MTGNLYHKEFRPFYVGVPRTFLDNPRLLYLILKVKIDKMVYEKLRGKRHMKYYVYNRVNV